MSEQTVQTSKEELLYLADQERHERSMMQEDNYDDIRASIIKEWALRSAAARFGVRPT